MRRFYICLLALTLAQFANAAQNISVKDAWVRLPPPGAEIGVAYLTLEAKQRTTLRSASSPTAKSVELHSMRMNQGVMQMRHLPAIQLEAGKPLKLEPGGLHLMLIDLKKPLKLGDIVELNLNFSQGKGDAQSVRVSAIVKIPDAK